MGAAGKLDLSGKDWLTIEEAAHYCGVSNSQFRKNAMGYGLTPRRFMGKQLYEKAALYAAIEGAEEWLRFDSTGAAARPTSTGRKAASAFAGPLRNLTPREAERIRAAKEAELTHGGRILARLPKVRDYLEWYLDWYEAEHPTTISKARSEMKRFVERFGHRPIDSIRAVGVEQYKRSRLLDDKAAKETVGKEIRRLKAAFNRGVEWKELDVNPLASVKAPRGVRSVAVKFYGRAVMRRLYWTNPARAPLWLFMAHTGLRRGEIIGLEKSSVVAGRLLVESDPDESDEGRTKSGKWREVPLNRYAQWALRHLPDPLVTVHKDTLSDWFKRDSHLAGIGGHPHRLRHTFCAHMVMAGVPLRRVQLLAGHADYATTEKYYAHLTPDGDDDSVAKLRF